MAGLDAPRMYPLYGLCAKLRAPVIIDISSQERWTYHRPQVEVVAADFPELDILLATPPGTDTESIIPLMQHFQRISFLLGPRNYIQMPCCASTWNWRDGSARCSARPRTAGPRRWRLHARCRLERQPGGHILAKTL